MTDITALVQSKCVCYEGQTMEWVTAEERTISGKGILKVPGSSLKVRAAILYVDVVRDPKNKYVNKDWNPERSRYGTLVFLRQGYVVNALPIEYDGQCFDAINDVCGQTLIALKCAYEGILHTFANLATAMSATPGGVGLFVTTIEDTIKDYENLAFSWDEIRVKCYADTALSVRLTTLKYDSCDPSKDKDRPPPLPPPPPEKVPPGTPIPNSQPYDPDTGDYNNSEPYPGDEPQEPTQGDPCILYNVVITYTVQTGDNPPSDPIAVEFQAYGKIGAVSVVANPGNYSYYYLKCQGIKGKPGAENVSSCSEYTDYRVGNNGYTYPAIFINAIDVTSVTPVG